MTNQSPKLVASDFAKNALKMAETFDAFDWEYMPKMSEVAPLLRALAAQCAAPPAKPAQCVPDGFELVAVKGFDELMYWLERCRPQRPAVFEDERSKAYSDAEMLGVGFLVDGVRIDPSRVMTFKALAPAPSQEPVTLTDEWCYSFDEERFSGDCASREEAIAEAKAEAEGNEHTHAWIGKAKHPREFISKKWLGVSIREYLSERLGDEVGEVAECFSLKPEQEEQLGAVVVSWIESGPGFRCWAVKDVEMVELADFDENGQVIAALREKEAGK